MRQRADATPEFSGGPAAGDRPKSGAERRRRRGESMTVIYSYRTYGTYKTSVPHKSYMRSNVIRSLGSPECGVHVLENIDERQRDGDHDGAEHKSERPPNL